MRNSRRTEAIKRGQYGKQICMCLRESGVPQAQSMYFRNSWAQNRLSTIWGTSDTKKGSALLKKGTEATRARQLKWITSCKVIISISVLLVLLLTIITITIIIITIIVVRVFEEYQVRNSPLVTFLIIRQGLPLRQKTFPAGIFWNQQLIIFWTQERGVYMYKDLVGLCIQFFWKVLVWSDLPYI